ncbi:MAG: hypothetical protein AB8E15_00695 [Bdellovibrionales bacterium]
MKNFKWIAGVACTSLLFGVACGKKNFASPVADQVKKETEVMNQDQVEKKLMIESTVALEKILGAKDSGAIANQIILKHLMDSKIMGDAELSLDCSSSTDLVANNTLMLDSELNSMVASQLNPKDVLQSNAFKVNNTQYEKELNKEDFRLVTINSLAERVSNYERAVVAKCFLNGNAEIEVELVLQGEEDMDVVSMYPTFQESLGKLLEGNDALEVTVGKNKVDKPIASQKGRAEIAKKGKDIKANSIRIFADDVQAIRVNLAGDSEEVAELRTALGDTDSILIELSNDQRVLIQNALTKDKFMYIQDTNKDIVAKMKTSPRTAEQADLEVEVAESTELLNELTLDSIKSILTKQENVDAINAAIEESLVDAPAEKVEELKAAILESMNTGVRVEVEVDESKNLANLLRQNLSEDTEISEDLLTEELAKEDTVTQLATVEAKMMEKIIEANNKKAADLLEKLKTDLAEEVVEEVSPEVAATTEVNTTPDSEVETKVETPAETAVDVEAEKAAVIAAQEKDLAEQEALAQAEMDAKFKATETRIAELNTDKSKVASDIEELNLRLNTITSQLNINGQDIGLKQSGLDRISDQPDSSTFKGLSKAISSLEVANADLTREQAEINNLLVGLNGKTSTLDQQIEELTSSLSPKVESPVVAAE